ncbi:hypothetical protein LCGC14_1612850 [marine sediment metagenome]|uniref:Uncharacterized protein n=1 Tax=marine sediment metagenome TaxID=412755 RepID=A0A0F9KNI9_9ZZZZ
MSLLTDEDIRKATFIPDEYGDPDFCVTLFGKDRDRAIADASQAKTLKAVAEWGDKWHPGHEWDNLPHHHSACLRCWIELMEAAVKGKLPGEE